MGNVLNVLPKSVLPRAKQVLREIWMAKTRDHAEAAFKGFVDTYGEKQSKAAEKLPASCGFPAAHWQSIRTANPIESTFATVRHRTRRSMGCLSRRWMLRMLFRAWTVRRTALAALR